MIVQELGGLKYALRKSPQGSYTKNAAQFLVNTILLPVWSLWAIAMATPLKDSLLSMVIPRVMSAVGEEFKEERQTLLRDVQGRVIDVGSGGGAYLKYCEHASEVVAIEPIHQLHAKIRTRGQNIKKLKIVCSLEEVGATEAPEPFDWVILGNVLCEVPNVPEALKQVDRLLKPGGRVYFSEHVGRPKVHSWTSRDNKAAIRRAEYRVTSFFASSSSSSRSSSSFPPPNIEEFGAHRRNPQWQERSQRWIILVDDEAPLRQAVGNYLSQNGYPVTACPDAITALVLLDQQEQPDALPAVIISDIRMPEMDGLEFLSKLRSNVRTIEIPVVLLTAKGQTMDRIEGYNAGADVYLPKPFDPDELVSIIDHLVLRKQELQGTEISIEDLKKDLLEIKRLLLEKGGGGVGNGWVQATQVFLTADERTVLEYLCQGLLNKQIAAKTFLSTRRVEQLLTSMYRKANVKNRTELVRWAISTGNVQI